MLPVCQADDRLPYAVSQAGFVTGVGLLIALAALTDWRAYICWYSIASANDQDNTARRHQREAQRKGLVYERDAPLLRRSGIGSCVVLPIRVRVRRVSHLFNQDRN